MKRSRLILVAAAIIIVVAVASLGVLFFSPGSVKVDSILTVSNNSHLTVSLLSTSSFTCNPGESFNVLLNLSSPSNMTLVQIYTTSSGFTITSVNSSLPMYVNSSTPLLVTVKAPFYASQGILFINMNASSPPNETFIIRYVISDWKKSFTSFNILNNGGVPVNLVKMYLYRSDGILVNSTDLSLPEVYPSQLGISFNCSISYNLATADELYYIKLVSAGGAVGLSPLMPLTCNCTH